MSSEEPFISHEQTRIYASSQLISKLRLHKVVPGISIVLIIGCLILLIINAMTALSDKS